MSVFFIFFAGDFDKKFEFFEIGVFARFSLFFFKLLFFKIECFVIVL
jgi:hypothetical protein